MKPSDSALLAQLAELEPRSTLALASWFNTDSPRRARILRVGASCCILVRSEFMSWLGYPLLLDQRDAPELARRIDRSPAIGLDGHPDDVEPLLAHMTRVGEVDRFRRMVVPAEQCGWDASDPSTRIATALDLDELDLLFEDYEVRFVNSAGARRHRLGLAVSRHAVVVHDGPDGIDAAGLTGGLTPGYLVLDQLRVATHARGQGLRLEGRRPDSGDRTAYGVGLLGSIVHDNPMTMPEDQGWMEQQLSVNLRLNDRLPGERRFRREALRAALTPRLGL
ncbi:MAG: hypothetical protein R2789_06085 [Microthrixaceae bacterium]